MPVKKLNPTEKLSLQSGSALKVYVTKADEFGIQVSFSSEKLTTMTESIKVPSPKNKIKSNKFMQPIPDLLLNNLKTGLKLEGIIVSSTPYAAFVNVNVFRKGKAETYTQVNGMLHRGDLHQRLTTKSTNAQSVNTGILEKGTKLTLYVKEVWKNSG